MVVPLKGLLNGRLDFDGLQEGNGGPEEAQSYTLLLASLGYQL